jgi:hypothetical protein
MSSGNLVISFEGKKHAPITGEARDGWGMAMNGGARDHVFKVPTADRCFRFSKVINMILKF